MSGRPWAVALLVLSWLACGAGARSSAAESADLVAIQPSGDSTGPIPGWDLLACDASRGAAVLRAPNGSLVLVGVGERLQAPPSSGAGRLEASPSALPTVGEVLEDRVLLDLPAAEDGGPDAVWIHVAAAGGTSRLQYLRRRPLPLELHERPVPVAPPSEGSRRSKPRRPE